MQDDRRSDEELVRLAAGGDDAALSALYHRYFPRVYDLALRIFRDRDVAALVVQSSFLRAFQGLGQESPAPFRLLLFAGVHHDIRERLRRRRGDVLEGEEAFSVVDPARLSIQVAAPELPSVGRAAWQTMRDVRPDEYELLDLNLRQGFHANEIAAITGTRPDSVRLRLDRLHLALEQSFSGLILLAHNRRACLDLDFLVGDDTWSVGLRRRITKHLEGCQTCQRTRSRFPSGAEAVAALVPAPAPRRHRPSPWPPLRRPCRSRRSHGRCRDPRRRVCARSASSWPGRAASSGTAAGRSWPCSAARC